jgi:superfamily II DNA or RNA helicase
MVKLVIRGNTTQILEDTNAERLLELDKHLSFYVIGAEHTQAFKGYVDKRGQWVKWDGYKKLLTPALNFSTGLLERVKTFYQDHGEIVQVIDDRPIKSKGHPRDLLPRLKELGKEPRPYQLDVIPAIEKHDRGIIKMATGAGKSLVAALITAHLGKKTIIYVVGKDLLYQFHTFFEQVFQEPIGLIGDGHCQIANINIASIWTVGQALGLKDKDIILDNEDKEAKLDKQKYIEIKKLLKETKVKIFDECHQCAAESFQQLYKATQAEHLYGMSGSPWRSDGQDLLLTSILGEYIIDVPASDLIAQGYLVKPTIKFLVPPANYDLDRNYHSVYKHYVVENEVRNLMVLKATQAMVNNGYQCLVLFSSLKHGKLLYELFSQHMFCVILDGSDDQDARQEVKDKVMSGEVRCVLASRIFDQGIDLPSLSGLVIASAGKSTTRALQRIGRVIRPYEGKKRAAVIDFYDQCHFLKEHSKIRKRIYESEKGFDVIWVEQTKKKV